LIILWNDDDDEVQHIFLDDGASFTTEQEVKLLNAAEATSKDMFFYIMMYIGTDAKPSFRGWNPKNVNMFLAFRRRQNVFFKNQIPKKWESKKSSEEETEESSEDEIKDSEETEESSEEETEDSEESSEETSEEETEDSEETSEEETEDSEETSEEETEDSEEVSENDPKPILKPSPKPKPKPSPKPQDRSDAVIQAIKATKGDLHSIQVYVDANY